MIQTPAPKSLTIPRAARRVGVATLALALGATMAACGKSSDASSSASPSAAVSGASSAPASAAPSASATPSVKPTVITSLDAIKVTPATVGQNPTVTAKWPLAINKTQVKVLTPGTGEVVPAGATVGVNYTGVNARTGKPFDSSFTRGQVAVFPLTGVVPGFTKAIQGQKVGSRVVVMMTAADGYPQGQPSAGIEKGDNLVFVIDIAGITKTVPAKAGLPVVKDDAKKVPTVTIPKTAAPTSLVVQPLTIGPGAKVTANQVVQVNYRSYNWADGKLLQDDYATGPETGAITSLIPAWQKALVGQTVGSRVLVVSPPNLAYGSAAPTPIPSNATLVYVIDILGAQAGS